MHDINIQDYNYLLPENKIARYPLEKRDTSKLLVFNKSNNTIQKDYFFNIIDHLPEKSLLVFNNTKVIPARLIFQKASGASIEIFCLEPHSPKQYEDAMNAKGKSSWVCMIGNAKKWKDETITNTIHLKKNKTRITARKTGIQKEKHIIVFEWDAEMSFAEMIEYVGQVPIPPYLKRKSEAIDKIRYQTVYSKKEGSVAAPTAGLHFTEEIISRLHEKQINIAEITLHVGAGTFLAVKTKNALDHPMHTEHFMVTSDTLQKIKESNTIIAVGTTSARTLESLYWLGVNIKKQHIEQFPWKNPSSLSKEKAIDNLIPLTSDSGFINTSTQIMIAPGYSFQLCKGIITNFHQPKSTLLLLIAAITGNKWKNIYQYALENNFRFLSYGDSSLLLTN